MTPKPDVSEARRSQIIDAALNVFSRLGFHEARMDDIVQESGLSKGGVYWYFKSKNEIIEAILDNIFQRELSGINALIARDDPAPELLHEFRRLTIRELQSMTRLLPIAYEFYALAFRNKTVRSAMKRYLQVYLESLAPLIQKGIDQGNFRLADAEKTAIAFGAAIEGTMVLWVFDPERINLEEQTNYAFDLLLSGLEVGR